MDESLDLPNDGIWSIADKFRAKVLREMANVSSDERESLRGDYLFIIDGTPLFVVLVDAKTVCSGSISCLENQTYEVKVEGASHLSFTSEEALALVQGAARATVETDNATLKKLLLGHLKARIAFLTGKVKIKGDLASFLRLVSVLKGRGVGPLLPSHD